MAAIKSKAPDAPDHPPAVLYGLRLRPPHEVPRPIDRNPSGTGEPPLAPPRAPDDGPAA
jgi:hypothetical protein